jgi:8-oxo-dGTP pyrophosphatase MutT (NUDIX family)
MPKIIIASGPVIVEDGKVLLNKHGDDKFWKFCGGRVEDYELNLLETARREFKEEMGAEFDVLNPVPFFFNTIKNEVDVILVHFSAKLLGEIVPGAEIREWGWFAPDQLMAMELAPNIIPTLKYFKFLK